MKTIFMETTKISCESTVGEIMEILREFGSTQILTEYEGKELSALSFKIPLNGKDLPFRLPCRWKAILQYFKARGKNIINGQPVENQAKRVAWRQILRWLQAQLALLDTKMVKMEEIFLPYLQINNKGQTVFEVLEEGNFKLLQSGDSI